METKVQVGDYQQATSGDINRISEFTETAIDRVVREGITAELKFAGLAVSAPTSLSVLVGEGSFYKDGEVYRTAGENTVSVQTLLPVVAKKIVALTIYGTEQPGNVEPRVFVRDVATRQAEARSVATTLNRTAQISPISGTEASEPVRPLIPANVIAFAWVTLSTLGVVSIEYAEANRLRSTQDNSNDIDSLQNFQRETGARLETVDTQITGLAERIRGTTPITLTTEIARDLAVLKQRAELPASYSSYGSDPFLDLAQSDSDHIVVTGLPTNPAFLCKVMEGIRFADAQARQAQLVLLNNDETRVRVQQNLMLPAFSEVARISSVGRDEEISISQYAVQTVDMVQRTVTRQRIRYGGYFQVCTNSAFWWTGVYDYGAGVLRRGTETFEVEGDPVGYLDLNNTDHRTVRLRQFWVDSFEEPYWDRVVTTSQATGSVIAQTFLNSQETWATSIGLFLTRKGAADLRVLLTEVGENGAPRYDKVVAQAVVPVSALKVWPEETKVPIAPTLLQRGKRYAIVPVSTGAHFFALTQNNKFAQGTLFTSTDGAWFQGDLLRDLAFQIYAARFVAPRVEVQLQPLELANGIAAIDILADTIIPSGCSLVYEVKIDNVWTPIAGGRGADPLAGLPPLLQLRVVLLGTVDLMPQLGLNARSQTLTTRPRTDLVHISTAYTPPAPARTITVTERYEGGFNPAFHSAVLKVLSGAGYATATSATVVENRAADDDPSATIRKYVFVFGTAIASFKFREEGLTDSALRCYHVAMRDFVSLTT